MALLFGSHLSIAGGLHNALLKAESYGFATTQVFTKNQQQWRAKPLEAPEIETWRGHCQRLNFTQTVSHASYLINVASPDPALWRKSLDLLLEEHLRCALLGIPYMVMHPGAHMGEGDAAGIQRIAEALDEVHATITDPQVITCIEGTAGQGSSIGHRLEHLAEITAKVKRPERMGVCLDTAHLFAAGYDFRDYEAFTKELKATVGIKQVRCWHLNDSKKDLGSRVDRHDHIGEGKIGLEGFRAIVNDSAWRNVPKILETPKEKADDGRDWDEINFQRLQALAR